MRLNGSSRTTKTEEFLSLANRKTFPIITLNYGPKNLINSGNSFSASFECGANICSSDFQALLRWLLAFRVELRTLESCLCMREIKIFRNTSLKVPKRERLFAAFPLH